jgi:DnaJ-class molecular chaperone
METNEEKREFAQQSFELEVTCPNCAGTPYKQRDDGSVSTCWKCKGEGVVPTPFGEQLLVFIARHWEHFLGLDR